MRSMMTFSSNCAFNASRFGRQRAICITNGAQNDGGGYAPKLICDKCGVEIMLGSSFCPQCGDPVTEADEVRTPIEPSVAKVILSFGHSTSHHYKRVVEICEKIPSYSKSGEEKDIRHEVTLPITEINLVLTIYNQIENWKSASMLINGRSSTRGDINASGMACYQQRQHSRNIEQYCYVGAYNREDNIWGCRNLHMPTREWGEGWLSDGWMDQDGIWHFDKNKIRANLMAQSKRCEWCPVFNMARVLQQLEKIPSEINPRVDPDWEYRTTMEQGDNGEFQEVAIGIRPVSNRGGCFVVRPTSYQNSGEDEYVSPDPEVVDINSTSSPRAPVKSDREHQVMLSIIAVLVIIILAMLIF